MYWIHHNNPNLKLLFLSAPSITHPPRKVCRFTRGLNIYLAVDLGIVCPFQKVVNGNIEIIRKTDQSFVVRFPLAVFIPADAVLVHIQIHGQLELGDAAFLS